MGKRSISGSSSQSSCATDGSYAKNFEEQELLGTGSFGQVFKVRNKMDDKCYAVKIIPVKRKGDGTTSDVFEEAKILATLKKHHHIVQYYNVWCEKGDVTTESQDQLRCNYNVNELSDISFERGSNKTTEDESESSELAHEPEQEQPVESIDFVYLQMELCLPKTLKDWLMDPEYKIRDNIRAALICLNIVDALSYIHSRKLIHRDLNPNNVFLTGKYDNFVPKLGDFGLAKSLKDDANIATSVVGTSYYISPELRKGNWQSCNHETATDIYSLGVIYFELLNYFLTGVERDKILKNFLQESTLPLNFISDYPKESNKILQMISASPEERPSASQISSDLVDLRKELMDIRRREEINSNKDRWWDFCFAALRHVSGESARSGRISDKKPKLAPSVILGETKTFLEPDMSIETFLQNNLNDTCRLGIIKCALLSNPIVNFACISQLLLFNNDSISSEILQQFLVNIHSLKIFRCFQILPYDFSVELTYLNPNLQELCLRGVKVNVENVNADQQNLKTLALFDCSVSGNLVEHCNGLFPQIQQLFLINCNEAVDNLPPLVNSTFLETVISYPKLIRLGLSIAVMFGNCEAIPTHYFTLEKNCTGNWKRKTIRPGDYKYWVSKLFCYEEVIKTETEE